VPLSAGGARLGAIRPWTKEGKAAMPKFLKQPWLAVAALLGVVAALAIPSAFAVSPHFNFANVTDVTSNSLTVSFKESVSMEKMRAFEGCSI
jgi:hypothetical protein